jgi:hypothetical protein
MLLLPLLPFISTSLSLSLSLQAWDQVIGHTPEAVAKSGKALVGVTVVVALYATFATCDE